MKPLLLILTISLLSIAFERATLPVTTPEMETIAYVYGTNHEKQTPPNSFKQDGCTLFPDKLFGSDFSNACFAHDAAYWYGGTEEEKNIADMKLKEEVAHTGTMGLVLQEPFYLGVHYFGDTWLTKLFDANWGFGWNK